MGKKRTDEENIRKIQKSKRSYYITLPIRDVRALGWREGQKIVIERNGKIFTIHDWEK